ncbi:heterokaryon incompatibility protein-domain-containing protein [Xylaria longipes]|nr:heterokaryon incompatibility protein-domain-containing protein [Xylaria longipes]
MPQLETARSFAARTLFRGISSDMPPFTLNDSEFRDEIYRFLFGILDWFQIVDKIVNELCQRDSRFQFIKESIHNFMMGDGRTGAIFAFGELVKHDPELRLSEPDPETLQPLEEIWESHENLARKLYDIICAVIYEILDAFDINIAISQIPRKFHMDDYVELVQDIHKRSENLPLAPVQSTPPKDSVDNDQERYTYRYSDAISLESKGKIRVLNIAPGSGQRCIECHLEVRDLYTEQVGEALSYVWGQRRKGKAIWIDGDLFQVNENLYDILIYLRHPHATRTIWVDAICINQLDLNEKAQQVRHMDEIYFKAKKTIIWLGGRTPDLLPTNDPHDILAPLPPNLGGHRVDQYDLVGILGKAREMVLDIQWKTEQATLGLMLIHCLNTIMSHEWWERVWTIQEAVLPQEHPHFMFQGHEFSFIDFISAISLLEHFGYNKIEHLSAMGPEDGLSTGDPKFLLNSIISQLSYWKKNNRAHLLRFLRPGHENQGLSNPMNRTLHFLLCETSYYRATDPRDKFFALQALVPKSKGRLMYVDYTKSDEMIFRRATAQCYNTSEHLEMTTTVKLLTESRTAGYNTLGPSWVQDFTYSDARFHDSDENAKVTFSGYLYTKTNWQPEYDHDKDPICFATPKTLFCSGLSIDIVRGTGFVPNLRDDEYSLDRLCTFLQGVQVHQNCAGLGGFLDDRNGLSESAISIIESMCTALCDATTGHPERIDELRAAFENSTMHQKILHLIYLTQCENNITLFSLGEISSFEKVFASRSSALQRRAGEISGMQYFVTDKGLVGIATAPVMEGDILAVLHATPAYFILREVKSSDGHSYVAQRHRMVARAVISEKQDKMKEKFADLETRIFEIV